jgi:hypothetical protein
VNHEEYYQEEHEFPYEHVEEEHFDEIHLVEDLIQKEAPHEDKSTIFSPPFDEVIQDLIPPTHKEKNVVSYTLFQNFNVALFYDSESKEVIEEPLDTLDPYVIMKVMMSLYMLGDVNGISFVMVLMKIPFMKLNGNNHMLLQLI